MRVKLFQMRDIVAVCQVGPIFMERSEGPAIRQFDIALTDPGMSFSKNPADYELLCVGEMDDSSGKMFEGEFPVVVRRGVTVIADAIVKEAQNA